MTVIGLDLASWTTGYAVLRQADEIQFIESGVFKCPKPKKKDPQPDLTQRIAFFKANIKDLIAKYPQATIVLEDIYLYKPTTFKMLAMMHGVIQNVIHESWRSFICYAPTQIKASIKESHATKEEIAIAVQRILGQTLEFATDDESDAVSIAIAHLNKQRISGG